MRYWETENSLLAHFKLIVYKTQIWKGSYELFKQRTTLNTFIAVILNCTHFTCTLIYIYSIILTGLVPCIFQIMTGDLGNWSRFTFVFKAFEALTIFSNSPSFTVPRAFIKCLTLVKFSKKHNTCDAIIILIIEILFTNNKYNSYAEENT